MLEPRLISLLISAFKSFTSATSSPNVGEYASRKEVDEIIMEEAKVRCDMYKYFEFSETDKLGMVSFLVFYYE